MRPLWGEERQALLVLEDGSTWWGATFAGSGETRGEVVFNTAMMGYEEVLTDPSYHEQIVLMTYPHMGNYGITDEDQESAKIYLAGLIVKEYHDRPSNWRSRRTLKDFLESHGKIGIEGVDTRALTRHIRTRGAMKGICSTEDLDPRSLMEKVAAYPGLVGRDLVREVTCREPYTWREGKPEVGLESWPLHPCFRVVVIDCGVKYNILRLLEERGCAVRVLPATAAAADILSMNPHGVLISNGPGDPAALTGLVATTRELLGRVPIFGICLGHQLLGQAMGARTEKLKFGHHGVNQPVQHRSSGRVEITSQNHGFVVVPSAGDGGEEATHKNLNDGTSEGMANPEALAMSVQHHPEAAPGPHDAAYLFDHFLTLMERRRL